jgi:hypothetical protein
VLLLDSTVAEWRDIPAAALGHPQTSADRFRAVNDWAFNNGYVGGFPNFHEANYGSGRVYGCVLLRHGSVEWQDISSNLLDPATHPSDIAARIKDVNRWAQSKHPPGIWLYDGGFPNFHQADYGDGLVYGTITFAVGSTQSTELLLSELGDPPTPEARFRAVNDWAAAQGYVAALPTFVDRDGKVYGSILIKSGMADWRDIPAGHLSNPKSAEERIRAVNNWASGQGYVSGFPNFHEADYGTEFGTVLLKAEAADWRDISAAELNFPPSFDSRFRAVNDWASAHSYIGGFPNFHEANYGSGTVYGCVLIKRAAADWRDVPAAELGNPTSPEDRIRAVNDWAVRNGYVSGFPNFHEADYGNGTVYGCILLKHEAADWRDLRAAELY